MNDELGGNWEGRGRRQLEVILAFAALICLVNSVIFIRSLFNITINGSGHALALLVEELRYKPEGGGFDSRWCYWNFLLI
jgi:hypothetical protein